MNLRYFFVVPPNNEAAQAAAMTAGAGAGGGAGADTPVFITPQAFATFPGASLAVLIIWKTLGLVVPQVNTGYVVPFIASLIVGGLIYYMSLTATMTSKDRAVGLFLAFVNSCYLALFVIGIPLTFGMNAPPTSQPKTTAAAHVQPLAAAPSRDAVVAR
jgi:hypothetical protein